jgi:excisionase family DNA binding protein
VVTYLNEVGIMSFLLTVEEVADRLGVSKYTLYKWRKDGFGPSFLRLRGNDVRYEENDLREWIEWRKSGSLAEERARGDRLHGAAESGGFR